LQSLSELYQFHDWLYRRIRHKFRVRLSTMTTTTTIGTYELDANHNRNGRHVALRIVNRRGFVLPAHMCVITPDDLDNDVYASIDPGVRKQIQCVAFAAAPLDDNNNNNNNDGDADDDCLPPARQCSIRRFKTAKFSQATFFTSTHANGDDTPPVAPAPPFFESLSEARHSLDSSLHHQYVLYHLELTDHSPNYKVIAIAHCCVVFKKRKVMSANHTIGERAAVVFIPNGTTLAQRLCLIDSPCVGQRRQPPLDSSLANRNIGRRRRRRRRVSRSRLWSHTIAQRTCICIEPSWANRCHR
jgi:hypothetical protein